MQKIIKDVDEKRGIVQCTIADERFYFKAGKDPQNGNPVMRAVPSVTWIAGHYPKNVAFYKWLADKGWSEAEAIKAAAGDKGSKVHEAISAILAGQEVRIDSKFLNRSTDQLEELTFEEVECIKSFIDWKATLKNFEPIAWDVVVFSEQYGYAGTIDLIARVDGDLYIIDFKTSQNVWPEYEMQVSAYRRTIETGENAIHERNPNGTDGKQINVAGLKAAILQIGYRRNKCLYKWTEIEDCFDLFLHAKAIWQHESGSQQPRKVDLPIVLSPARTAPQVEEARPTPPEGGVRITKSRKTKNQ
jgi:hypothetical protein